MAKTKLSKATFVEFGYGQVEPNHLSAMRPGQIYAQLPSGEEVLEQGMFAKYDYENNEVNFDGEGEAMLVFCEEKVYDARQTNADFACTKDNGGYPRLFKTNVGDIFTTNTVNGTKETLVVGAKLAPGADGILAVTESSEGMIWNIVKVYTLADGQAAVKIQRIQ